MSNLSALEYIQERSQATPGLWNQRYSVISANLAALNSDLTLNLPSGETFSLYTNLDASGNVHAQRIGIGATPSAVTRGMLTIAVSSALSDYIHFEDSSEARSDYLLGSRVGGTSDGLNLYDLSGDTMIVSFSKQSVRFYQNVVGPVFDVGGALADTYNAATFGTGAQSKESRIQAAISQAVIDSVSRVYVPANMYPYSAGSVSFDTRVQMVREGGDWSVHDVWAYGATGDGIVDDYAAVQSSLSNAIYASNESALGVIIFFPGGTYSISTTLTILDKERFILRGVGQGGSRLLWSGSSGLPMLRMTNVGRSRVEDFGFWGNPSATPSACVEMSSILTPRTVTSVRFMQFKSVRFGSSQDSNVQYGLRWTATFDSNNDNSEVEGCEFLHCTVAAISMEHAQSKGHFINRCKINSCGRGIATDLGAGNVGGSFYCTQTQMGDNAVADFALGGPDDAIVIAEVNSEGANRFLQTTGPVGITWPVLLSGVRYADDKLNVDGNAIIFRNAGPLTLLNCQFPSTYADSTNTPCRILIDGTVSGATLLERIVSIGNKFNTITPYTFTHASSVGLLSMGNQSYNTSAAEFRSITDQARNSRHSLLEVGTTFSTALDSGGVRLGIGTGGSETIEWVATASGNGYGFRAKAIDYLTGEVDLGIFHRRNATSWTTSLVLRGATNAWGFVDGTALAPPTTFLSERSLGWYRSGNSTVALSYGTLAVDNIGLGSGSTITVNSAIAGLRGLIVRGGVLQLGTTNYSDRLDTDATNTYIKGPSNVFFQTQAGANMGAIGATGISTNTHGALSGNTVFLTSHISVTGNIWGSSGLSIGGGTLIPQISSISSLVGAFVVQGSASSFTGIAWAAAGIGDIITVGVIQSGAASSISSGLIAHSHVTVAGQIEFRLSNVSTLVQNQSAQSWVFTRIRPF